MRGVTDHGNKIERRHLAVEGEVGRHEMRQVERIRDRSYVDDGAAGEEAFYGAVG